MAGKTKSEKPREGESAVDAVTRRFGAGAVFVASAPARRGVPVFPTGIDPLDAAIGVGGVPWGRVVEVYGPESSGKTTLCLHVVAAAQRAGDRMASFIDAEHALDLGYAEALGVDVDRLLVSQPSCGEEALGIAEVMCLSDDVGIVVVDSVAALTPRAEIEGEMGDSHVGLHARLMSQALRKLTAIADRTATTVVFINQIRSKIGVTFGSPETTTGGNALKFYASLRLDVRRIQTVKDSDGVPVASRTRIKVVKNKLAPPFREAEVDVRYGTGIDVAGAALEAAVLRGVVTRSGSWFSFRGERIACGRDAAADVLRGNPELLADVRSAEPEVKP